MSPGNPGSRGQKLRADARQNRDAVLAAARELLLTRGAEVPMRDIADRAGVGVGTLYRRFPDREALLRALAIDGVEAWTATAEVGAQTEDPWGAFTRFAHAGEELATLLAVLRPRLGHRARHDSKLQAAGRLWFRRLSQLVAAAQAAGAMRDDVSPGDVALLLSQVTHPLPAGTGDPSLITRMLDLALDALRAPAAGPLSGQPYQQWFGDVVAVRPARDV